MHLLEGGLGLPPVGALLGLRGEGNAPVSHDGCEPRAAARLVCGAQRQRRRPEEERFE